MKLTLLQAVEQHRVEPLKFRLDIIFPFSKGKTEFKLVESTISTNKYIVLLTKQQGQKLQCTWRKNKLGFCVGTKTTTAIVKILQRNN